MSQAKSTAPLFQRYFLKKVRVDPKKHHLHKKKKKTKNKKKKKKKREINENKRKTVM